MMTCIMFRNTPFVGTHKNAIGVFIGRVAFLTSIASSRFNLWTRFCILVNNYSITLYWLKLVIVNGNILWARYQHFFCHDLFLWFKLVSELKYISWCTSVLFKCLFVSVLYRCYTYYSLEGLRILDNLFYSICELVNCSFTSR